MGILLESLQYLGAAESVFLVLPVITAALKSTWRFPLIIRCNGTEDQQNYRQTEKQTRIWESKLRKRIPENRWDHEKRRQISSPVRHGWNRTGSDLTPCGKLVGRIPIWPLWLAPGLIIQRNPQAVEILSIIPKIRHAWTIAAAMTKGVQSRPIAGVTVKHLPANNQEDNLWLGVDGYQNVPWGKFTIWDCAKRKQE